MSKRHARITQVEMARVIRAAKEAGASNVVVCPSDGTMKILLVDDISPRSEISEQEHNICL